MLTLYGSNNNVGVGWLDGVIFWGRRRRGSETPRPSFNNGLTSTLAEALRVDDPDFAVAPSAWTNGTLERAQQGSHSHGEDRQS